MEIPLLSCMELPRIDSSSRGFLTEFVPVMREFGAVEWIDADPREFTGTIRIGDTVP
ncbi:hypothetical protein AB0G60_07685 [Streptomyces angustmyceticus]|nr:hypothetical protein [Streptomyces angustmyceticus]UAL69325.1 hypothetical protein K7396_24615 [Streptomyces angustmyceticus]